MKPHNAFLATLLAGCAPCPPCPPPQVVEVEVPRHLPPGQPAPAAVDPAGWAHAPDEGRDAWVPGGWALLPTRELDALCAEIALWRAWAEAAASD